MGGSRRILGSEDACADGQNDDREDDNDEVVDEDRQLVWEETEVILDGISAPCWYLALAVLHRCQFNVYRVIQAHGQKPWFSNTHCPTHALDRDLPYPACELAVLDLAVIVVIARVDLGDILGA